MTVSLNSGSFILSNEDQIMFLGHFGIGFGAKKFAPKISLGTLFIAAQFADLLWPTLLLLNIEYVTIHPELENARSLAFTDYPISHSLLLIIKRFFYFLPDNNSLAKKLSNKRRMNLRARHYQLSFFLNLPDAVNLGIG
jgi:hypothetical protein